MANLRAELKAELDRAGLFVHQPAKVYGKFVLLALVTAGFFALTILAGPWWLKVPPFLAGLVASIALVMIGHDAGHGAVSPRQGVNDLLGYLAFPVAGGMSLTYWKYKHNTLHHSYPNVIHKDPDTEVYPFAFSREQRAKGGLARFIQAHQGLFFWPLTALTTFAMRLDGVKFLFGRGRRLAPARDRALDLAAIVLHHLLWLAVPVLAFHLPLLHVALFYVAWSMGSGLLLAAIFMPAHMVLPLFRTYDENFVLQLRTTQNLRTNRLFSFLMIGLDHQLEHHLFQRMSHLSAKRAAPIVRAFCARRGLPYFEQDWGAALWAVTKRLDVFPEYELLERPPEADREAMFTAPVVRGLAEFSSGIEPRAG